MTQKNSTGGTTVTAVRFSGVHLTPVLGPPLLEACTPPPPLASPNTIDMALQPHVVAAIAGYATTSLLDAA